MITVAANNQLLGAALRYAELGWHVFPVYSISQGQCTCGDASCRSAGKHPRLSNGLKGASVDQAIINQWWTKWPDANVGIRTGAISGIIAIDIDPRHGGDGTLTKLINENGQLPPTTTAITGSGGHHLIMAHPGVNVSNRTNLWPGIDVRSDGGYIVVPPSNHASGGTYQWSNGSDPWQCEPASIPNWVLEALVKSPGNHACKPTSNGDEWHLLIESARRYIASADSVAEGQRNSAAFRLAGNLASFESESSHHRLSESDIFELMADWNRGNQPPLDDRELRQVVQSAMKNGSPRQPHLVHLGTKAWGCRHSRRVDSRHAQPYKSFPVEVFPEPAAEYVQAVSEAIGCDPAYVALPLLSAMAAAVGNSRQIQLKQGWCEPAIIWTAIIGESGTHKTPAMRQVLKPIHDLQADAIKNYEQALKQFQQNYQVYEKEFAAWKRSKNAPPLPPVQPEPPAAVRLVVADTTVEALAPILKDNPRGVLMARDELAGWIGSFDRYAAGRGGDSANWLSMHVGESLIVDRKTGIPRTIFIPKASVSVTGGIQPRILDRMLSTEHRESGLAARLLMSWPPRKARQWREAEIDPRYETQQMEIFKRLLSLQPETDENNRIHPLTLRLTPDAQTAWVEFYNAHAQEQLNLDGDEAAVWSKLEGYAARFALIFHLVQWAATGEQINSTDHIEVHSVEAGIRLSQWFGQETLRVYGQLTENEDEQLQRQVIELIQRRGGCITKRELQQSCRPLRNDAALAEQTLQSLADAGWGRWEGADACSQNGQSKRAFVLSTCLPSTTSTNPIVDSNSGDFADGSGDDGAQIG
ncbi:MAG: hypothetical protein HJJLKODD_02918 [Phycisphaerae bacterium]|nr:hypothetical protein [Phycisphaerae bacterium]